MTVRVGNEPSRALEEADDAAKWSCARPVLRAGSLPAYLERVDRSFVSKELQEVRCITLTWSEGKETTLYEYGSQNDESIVLLPPYGMTFVLVSRLAMALAERHHVVIWESNGSPDSSAGVSDADFSLDAQAAQFAAIIAARGLSLPHFVGWCQAAQIASYAVARQQARLASMSWVAPAGLGYALLASEFDRCALPVYLEIERHGLTHADKFRQILNKHAHAATTDAILAEKLTMLHLVDAPSTHVFSRYMKAYDDNKLLVKPTLDEVVNRVPTLAMHSRDDTFSHFSESVQIAKKHKSVQLRVLDNGGHLQVFNSPRPIAGHISELIRSVGSAKALGSQVITSSPP